MRCGRAGAGPGCVPRPALVAWADALHGGSSRARVRERAPCPRFCWVSRQRGRTSSLGKGHPSKATAPATRAVRRRSVRGGGCMRKGLLAAVRTSTSPIRAAGDRSVARLRLCQHWCKLRPCSQGVARGRSRCSVGVWLVVRPVSTSQHRGVQRHTRAPTSLVTMPSTIATMAPAGQSNSESLSDLEPLLGDGVGMAREMQGQLPAAVLVAEDDAAPSSFVRQFCSS